MSTSPAQPAIPLSSPVATRGWMIALLLALLVAAMPFTRAVVQLLGPGLGSMARQQIALLELLVIGLAFSSRSIVVPPLTRLPRALFWLVAAWFAWSAIAVALSVMPAVSLVRQMEWTVHGLFAWSLCAIFAAHPALKDAIPRWYVWGLLLYLMPITFFLGNIPDPQHFPWLGAMVGFTNIRHFGHYAAIALLAAHLPLLKARDGEWPRPSSLLILAVLWGTVFWSGGRGPLVAIFGSLAILTAVGLVPSAKRFWGTTLAAAAVGAMASIPLTPPDHNFGFLHLSARTELTTDIDRYSSGRMDIWHNVLQVIRDHPLFGVGPDQFRITVTDPTGWYSLHPHNGPLQAMLDWGVPGAMLFFGGMLAAMLLTRSRLRRTYDAHQLLGLWLLLMLLIFSLVSGTLYYALPLSTMAIALALMFATNTPQTDITSKSSKRPWDVITLYGTAATVFLLSGLSLWSLTAPGTPSMNGGRIAILQAFPSAMTPSGAGERLENWISQWREDGLTDGYAWLDWTAARSATPWTSMALKGQFMIEDGHAAEGEHWLEEAAARQHPLWKPPKDRLSDLRSNGAAPGPAQRGR